MTQKPKNEPFDIEGAREFDEFVSENGTVLVDFYADWCAPCRMMEPAVESVAERDGFEVAKVNIDENQRVASAYGVRSVPTVVLFEDGEAVRRDVGAKSEEELVEFAGG